MKNNWANDTLIRIIHVDDDLNQLKMLSQFIELLEPNLKMISFTSPKEAIEYMKKNYADCIISDYNMPKMNGLEFASQVRKKHSTPIILYTGQGSEEVAEQAFEIGIDDYLRKELEPSHYLVLINKIKNIVEKSNTEKLYQNIVDYTRDALCIIIDSQIIFHNKAMNELLQIRKNKSLIQMNLNEYLMDEDVERFNAWLNNEENSNLDIFKFKKIKNEFIEVEISKSEIEWHGIKAKVLFCRNITYRRQLESEKKVTQKRYRSLVDLVPDGILSMNPLGFITFVNKAFLELTGYSRHEIQGKHITKVGTIRQQDIFNHLKTFASIIRGTVPPPVVFHWKNKERLPKVGQGHISLINIDGKKEILLVARDVTDQLKKEEEFKNLYEYAPDGIIQIDVNGLITSVNLAVTRLSGYEKEEIIGKHFSDFIKLDDLDEDLDDGLYSFLQSPENLKPYEFRIIKKDSSIIWLEGHPSLLMVTDENQSPETHGIQVILRDISDRKKIEEQNKLYAEHLEDLVEERTNQILSNEKIVSVGKAASMIAHDIRSPLQIIRNAVFLIKKGENPPEKYLDIIENQVSLADHLLTEFKNQAKTTSLNVEKYSIIDVIQESLIPVRLNSKIKLELDLEEDIPEIEIDNFKLRRVFDNFFKNAIEAMPKGGTLHITAYQKDEDIVVMIKDTGVGIPDDVKKNLFKPFFSTKKSGIGLGLNFCKNVVETHGGTITVQSKINVGTTMTIMLPISKPKNLPEISNYSVTPETRSEI